MAKKILVIDDEPDALTFIETVLLDNGFEPLTTTSAVESLNIAKQKHPDLILLDLIMPDKSGITVFQELKTEPVLKDIPVIVVSGVSQVTGADFRDFSFKLPDPKGQSNGEVTYVRPEGFVEKPIDPSELLRVIEEVLRGHMPTPQE